jgi:imidazolonepropionase-like amidohydrolase
MCDGKNRLLRWEAGWAREYGLTTFEALATVTVNPADMFGLPNKGRIIVGQDADFFL